MTTIIGIYDDGPRLEKAIEQLTGEGFEEEVLDPAVLVPQTNRPVQPGPALSPAPGVAAGTPTAARPPETDEARQDAVRVLRDRLGRLHLSDDEIEHYSTLFNHKAIFLIVKSDAGRAEQAVEIMRANGASQVREH